MDRSPREMQADSRERLAAIAGKLRERREQESVIGLFYGNIFQQAEILAFP